MANSVSVDEMANEITRLLTEYTDAISSEVKKAVDDVSQQMLKDTRSDAPKRTGRYRQAMAVDTRYESRHEKRNTWYVKSPHYRLSHLLEMGHAKRGGGRVRAYPHIFSNAEKAKKELENRIKGAIQNG